MYMYIRICIHTHTDTDRQTDRHTHTHTHTHTYTHTWVISEKKPKDLYAVKRDLYAVKRDLYAVKRDYTCSWPKDQQTSCCSRNSAANRDLLQGQKRPTICGLLRACRAERPTDVMLLQKLSRRDLIEGNGAAQTKQVSKETYYRGKRDLLYEDF